MVYYRVGDYGPILSVVQNMVLNAENRVDYGITLNW